MKKIIFTILVAMMASLSTMPSAFAQLSKKDQLSVDAIAKELGISQEKATTVLLYLQAGQPVTMNGKTLTPDFIKGKANQQEQLEQEEQEVETIPFQMVEQKPSFNGGDVNEFVRWIKEQITNQSYNGRVALALVVKHDGSVENVRVIRGLDPKLDEQVVRIASSSPKWTPGRQKGKLVNVEYSMLPIAFSSSQSSSASTASSDRGTQGSAQKKTSKLTTSNLTGTIWEERKDLGPVVINTTFRFLPDSKVEQIDITTNKQTFLKKQYDDIWKYSIIDEQTIKVYLSEGTQVFNLSSGGIDSYLTTPNLSANLKWVNNNSWKSDFSFSTPITQEEQELIKNKDTFRTFIVTHKITTGYVLEYNSKSTGNIVVKPRKIISSNEQIIKPYREDGIEFVSGGKAILYFLYSVPNGKTIVIRCDVSGDESYVSSSPGETRGFYITDIKD